MPAIAIELLTASQMIGLRYIILFLLVLIFGGAIGVLTDSSGGGVVGGGELGPHGGIMKPSGCDGPRKGVEFQDVAVVKEYEKELAIGEDINYVKNVTSTVRTKH